MTRFQPRPARSIAHSAPSPVAEPVTIATLPDFAMSLSPISRGAFHRLGSPPKAKQGRKTGSMADLFSMKNRVVLLTGASRGLGRDMAITLAAAGATVLCAGRTVKELEATARAITRKGGKAQVVPLDITDEAAVREQVDTLIRRHRRIDVLVNNAGIIYREAIVDTSTDTFRSAIETDLVSQFMLAREVG